MHQSKTITEKKNDSKINYYTPNKNKNRIENEETKMKSKRKKRDEGSLFLSYQEEKKRGGT